MSTKNNFVDINGNDIENKLYVETDSHGLMCPEDKSKLDGIASGANKTVVDSAISSTSTNPVQNSVINTELNKKMNSDNPTGTGSFSINRSATATVGNHSIAMGYNAAARSDYSVAIGKCVSTHENAECQVVIGKYNTSQPYHIFVIGNGEEHTVRNAHTLDNSGNAWYAGDVTTGTGVSLNDHTHQKLVHPTTQEEVVFVYDSTVDKHFLRSTSPSTTYCGSESVPWYKVFTERLEVTESRIQCQPTYDTTTTYTTNMYVGTTGIYSRTTKTSSKTIKRDIKPVEDKELNPENLYELPVVQFKYNQEDVNLDENDCRYNKNLIGFIIEDMDEKFPIAIDKPSDNVKEWSWNDQYMIPAMLKLIQDQKKEIEALKEEIKIIKNNMANI